jgi:alanine dehydrogenase
MIIGVPTEIKTDEYRVAMLPVGVEELVNRGHQVIVQAGAGLGSGFADHDYLRAGAELVSSGADVFGAAELIVKVKEPLSGEYSFIRSGQLLFTYFHFAASLELTQAMLDSGASCFAYETLRDSKGTLPLLTPMSEVAGRMSIQRHFAWRCSRRRSRPHHDSRRRCCGLERSPNCRRLPG